MEEGGGGMTIYQKSPLAIIVDNSHNSLLFV